MKCSEDVHAPRSRRQDDTRRLLQIAHEDARSDRGPADSTPSRPSPTEALDEAIVINLPVASSLASRHKDRGIPLEDLEQVARLALVRAAQQFDPGRDRDFLSYAVPTIRGELRKHFRDCGWMIRPPRSVQEAQTRVVATRDGLAERNGHVPTEQEIAEHLGEDVSVVRESLRAQGCFHPTSLDLPIGEESSTSLAEHLGGEDAAMEAAEARVMLRDAVRQLSPRDRQIVRMRFFEDRTQQEIADVIGVTQMQVSRLISRILRDLRQLLGSEPVPSPAA
jgi:RNA polymerase sigma-B factor